MSVCGFIMVDKGPTSEECKKRVAEEHFFLWKKCKGFSKKGTQWVNAGKRKL